MKANSKGIEGFTLMELLAIIVIIGILAALSLTTISQAKGRALRIQCANNTRQLGIALQGFVQERRAYPIFVSTNTPYGDSLDNEDWMKDLQHGDLSGSTTSTGLSVFRQGVWRCPAEDTTADFCYGYNGYGLFIRGGLTQPTGTPSFGLGGHKTYRNTGRSISLASPPVAESEVVCPSEMMAIGDSDDFLFKRPFVDFAAIENSPVYARHKGRANVVFCDGHVESPKMRFLFADASEAALIRWNRDHLPHLELVQ